MRRARTQYPGTSKETTTAATWQAMHDTYVIVADDSPASLADVAQQYGVNVHAATNRANREYWCLERQVRRLRAELAKVPEDRRWRRYCTATDLNHEEARWKLKLAQEWKRSVMFKHELPPYFAALLPSEPEMKAILGREDLEHMEHQEGPGYDQEAIAEHRLEAEAAIAEWNRIQGAAVFSAAVSLPPDPGLAPIIDLAAYRAARGLWSAA